MHILNLKTKQISKNINEVNFNEDYNFIVCNPWELKFFKDNINNFFMLHRVGCKGKKIMI